jgi:hypothetical protein
MQSKPREHVCPLLPESGQIPDRFIGFLTTASPSSSGSEQMVAFRTGLKSVGLAEPDEAAIQAAIEANDSFVARLQAIVQASGINPEVMN